MAKSRKNYGAVALRAVVTIVFLLLVAAVLCANLLFLDGPLSREIRGQQIYLTSSDTMEPEIEQSAAVFVEPLSASQTELGNVLLWKTDAGYQIYRLALVLDQETQVASEPSESTVFYAEDLAGNTVQFTAQQLVGRCDSKNLPLGTVLNFLISKAGIICCLIVPCVILLLTLILRFLASRQEDIDEDQIAPSFAAMETSHRKAPQSPLFNPSESRSKHEDFERRKASIAENFAKKERGEPERKKDRRTQRQAEPAAQSSVSNKAEEIRRALQEASTRETDALAAREDLLEAALQPIPEQGSEPKERFSATKKALQHEQEQHPAAEQKPEPKQPAVSESKPVPGTESIDELLRILEEEKQRLGK